MWTGRNWGNYEPHTNQGGQWFDLKSGVKVSLATTPGVNLRLDDEHRSFDWVCVFGVLDLDWIDLGSGSG